VQNVRLWNEDGTTQGVSALTSAVALEYTLEPANLILNMNIYVREASTGATIALATLECNVLLACPQEMRSDLLTLGNDFI